MFDYKNKMLKNNFITNATIALLDIHIIRNTHHRNQCNQVFHSKYPTWQQW